MNRIISEEQITQLQADLRSLHRLNYNECIATCEAWDNALLSLPLAPTSDHGVTESTTSGVLIPKTSDQNAGEVVTESELDAAYEMGKINTGNYEHMDGIKAIHALIKSRVGGR